MDTYRMYRCGKGRHTRPWYLCTLQCFLCFQWLQVLDLIAKALNENSIKYHLLNQKKTFQVCTCTYVNAE